jgi:dihydroorotase
VSEPFITTESDQNNEQSKSSTKFHYLYSACPQITWLSSIANSASTSSHLNEFICDFKNSYESLQKINDDVRVAKKSKISFSVESIIGKK